MTTASLTGGRRAVALLRMLLLLLLLTSWSLVVVSGGKSTEEKPLFILGKLKKVVASEGGEVKVVRGHRWKGDPNPMQIGFISMNPNSLFIPQYIDGNIVLFVQTGEVKLGWIRKSKFVERKLKTGDVNVIPAGSPFYMVNHGMDEKVQIICTIDTSESLGWNFYQSFFIGGGTNPTSVLGGFSLETLTAAFNVSSEEITSMMNQNKGPIIHMNETFSRQHQGLMASLLGLKLTEEVDIDDCNDYDNEDDTDEEESACENEKERHGTWLWRKLLESIIGRKEGGRRGSHRVHPPHSYNLYDHEPSFQNEYGWSISIDKHHYSSLRHSNIGVYLVNLIAGSMLAPHMNPRATEYGVVLRGAGTVQVVFPNGTSAMSARVSAGDVFWIPRYFPFCQTASLDGPFEIFGFTTSAKKNRPQFFAGAQSVLRSVSGQQLAAGFGVEEEEMKRILEAQRYSVVLPPLHAEAKVEKEMFIK